MLVALFRTMVFFLYQDVLRNGPIGLLISCGVTLSTCVVDTTISKIPSLSGYTFIPPSVYCQ